MATATVVPQQEVDVAIAQLEWIEAKREESALKAYSETQREEYEKKRLKGRSHWAIAHKCGAGATKGRGSRVFIEANKIYSYGHHFVLATRKEQGDWGCGVKFIVNGDRYSVSTSAHTNLVIGACKPNVQIPYSALEAAGLSEPTYTRGAFPSSDLQVVAYEDDRFYEVCQTCGRDIDDEKTIHLCDVSPICPAPDGQLPWRNEHVLGGVLVALGGTYYLSGIDQNEPWRLRTYFLCQLPHAANSIEEAYKTMKPQKVKDAEVEGIEVRRQGDVFLIRVTRADESLLKHGRHRLVKDHSLWNGTHHASRALIGDGRVFVSGKLTHERHQHRTVFFKHAWYEAVKNTAVASWNAAGSVD